VKIRTLLALVFGVIIALTVVRSYWAADRLSSAVARYDELVGAHDATLAALRRVQVAAIDMETAIGGYELTGADGFLDPYRDAEPTLETALTDLTAAATWDERARAHAESAADLLRRWDTEIARPIVERRTAGTDRTAAQIEGRRQMDAIRAELATLEAALAETRVSEGAGFRALDAQFATDVWGSSAFMLFVVLLLAGLSFRAIDAPLASLLRYADGAGRGSHAALATTGGVAEVEQVGRALERLSSRASAREERDRAFAALGDALVKERTVDAIAAAGLAHVASLTGALGGCILVSDESGKLLVRAALGATPDELSRAGSALASDAARTGRLQRLELEDDAILVRSAMADVEPSVLAAIPALTGERVVAVLELLDPKGPLEDAEIARATARLALAIESALAETRAESLRTALASSNHELEAQNEELRAQEEELRAQTEALHRSQDELATRNGELERATRAKSEFLSRMSHELRTPLNAVLGFSDLLLHETGSRMTDEERRFAADIHDAGEQLLRLVNDVLDLARIEAGALMVEPRDLDLGLVLTEAATMLSPACRRRSITLDLTGIEGVLTCSADPGRLRQVAVNLLGNAVKFGAEGGRVRVVARAQGGAVRVEITDDGQGIAESDVHRLFQPFSQLAGGRAHGGGAGLGLSIVKQLVQQMRGSVGVRSKPGHGATFWFELPRSGALPIGSDRPPAAPTVTGSALVVEDRASDAETIAELLGRAGYDVTTVARAEQALDALVTLRPHIILVDLGLPGMPGEVLIERLARMPEIASVPIVALTGRALTEPERQELLASGASFVAQKGVMTGAGFLGSLRGLAPVSRAAGRSDANARAAPVRVLVVDDVEVNRRVLREMLPHATHAVQAASSAREALELLTTETFDIVLMDVQMPEMDGLAATRAIHAAARTRDLPVVAVTAQAMVGDRERAVAAGCVGYLAKPVGRAELIAAIASAISSQSQSAPTPVRS
jgi:signal transduction histidine kinase/CheY-like chemotaxis protein/CHASE3 domain sensor protein